MVEAALSGRRTIARQRVQDAAAAARRELTELSYDEDTVAIDGSKPALNAVAYVLNLSRQGFLLEVELLNVRS